MEGGKEGGRKERERGEIGGEINGRQKESMLYVYEIVISGYMSHFVFFYFLHTPSEEDFILS